ncbi:hypothetical protein ACE1CD_01025 [Aerosakkonema sp. BLCC-F183]|uniref:hypothetical protein n=1 Tax=Aerosakkonema sp. BLCC-F183 TaxID=3342834 RepID=UPI0035BB6317
MRWLECEGAIELSPNVLIEQSLNGFCQKDIEFDNGCQHRKKLHRQGLEPLMPK